MANFKGQVNVKWWDADTQQKFNLFEELRKRLFKKTGKKVSHKDVYVAGMRAMTPELLQQLPLKRRNNGQ